MITFTQADLDNLKAAFVTGASEVQIGDRKVTYRSQAEILAAIQMVEEALSGSTVTSSNNATVIQAGFSRKVIPQDE